LESNVNEEQNDDTGSSIVSSKSYHSKDVTASALLLESQTKKFSPIGRFVSENNMKLVAGAAGRSEIVKQKGDCVVKSLASIESDSLVASTDDSRKPPQRRRSGMWAPTKLSYDVSPKKGGDLMSSRSTDSNEKTVDNRSPPSVTDSISTLLWTNNDKIDSTMMHKQQEKSPALEQILEEATSGKAKPGSAEASFKYVKEDGSLEILHANDLSNIPYEVLPTYVVTIDDDYDSDEDTEGIQGFGDDEDIDENASMSDDLLMLLTEAPLRTMGPSVMDLLNRQEVRSSHYQDDTSCATLPQYISITLIT